LHRNKGYETYIIACYEQIAYKINKHNGIKQQQLWQRECVSAKDK